MKIVSAKYAKDPLTGLVVSVVVVTESGFTLGVPLDPANTDYAAYLEWVAAGNTPLPSDEEAK